VRSGHLVKENTFGERRGSEMRLYIALPITAQDEAITIQQVDTDRAITAQESGEHRSHAEQSKSLKIPYTETLLEDRLWKLVETILAGRPRAAQDEPATLWCFVLDPIERSVQRRVLRL
jgi:hypothetical protein